MFSWLEFAITLMKLVNNILNWVHDEGLIDSGRRQVLAAQALAIAKKVQTKNELLERINAMDDAEVDKELRDLEPPATGKP